MAEVTYGTAMVRNTSIAAGVVVAAGQAAALACASYPPAAPFAPMCQAAGTWTANLLVAGAVALVTALGTHLNRVGK